MAFPRFIELSASAWGLAGQATLVIRPARETAYDFDRGPSAKCRAPLWGASTEHRR